MPGTPKPDAVLLVLDSLHLTRQLMLAAPVLALGLPTLVLLNMSDLMESRGGDIDHARSWPANSARLSRRSAPYTAPGLDAVPLFLNQARLAARRAKAEQRLTLPVLGNAASTHTWAAQVSRSTGYRAPLSAENSRKLDNILLHRIWGPLLFLVVVIGVFEVVFSIGQPLSATVSATSARQDAATLCGRFFPQAGCNRWCSTAHGRASRRCLSSCPRFCCCFSSSEFLKTPATLRAPR